MSRPRALLAVLLALTWCSAAWHVDLEAVGQILEHSHHVHEGDPAAHVPPGGLHDQHVEVFARDVAKEQLRVGTNFVGWLAVVGGVSGLALAVRTRRAAPAAPRRRRETDPPWVPAWQFLRRCALLPAAPPAGR